MDSCDKYVQRQESLAKIGARRYSRTLKGPCSYYTPCDDEPTLVFEDNDDLVAYRNQWYLYISEYEDSEEDAP